jgi:hypothetical protein
MLQRVAEEREVQLLQLQHCSSGQAEQAQWFR